MSLIDMKARHEAREGRERILPAEHEKLQKIDALMGVGNEFEALGHMTREQIWTFSVYKAFHAHLVAGGVDVGQFLARKRFTVAHIDPLWFQGAEALAAPLPSFLIEQIHGLAGHGVVDEQVPDKGLAAGSDEPQ